MAVMTALDNCLRLGAYLIPHISLPTRFPSFSTAVIASMHQTLPSACLSQDAKPPDACTCVLQDTKHPHSNACVCPPAMFIYVT